jgi:hypothetical protein
MKKLIIVFAITLMAATTVHSQNSPLQVNSSPSSNFMTRFAVEGGVNIAYPIQNLARYNTSDNFNFTASIYSKIVNNFYLYINYSNIKLSTDERHREVNYMPDFYVPFGNIKVYNIGANYSYEYKKHFPFIEGGIGIYSIYVNQPYVINLITSKTQFGANLGVGYRYQFDTHIGLFVKGKLHTFSYDSKYWSLWNLSGGVFVKL